MQPVTPPRRKIIVALITTPVIIDLPLKLAGGPLSQSLDITYCAICALRI